VIAAVEELHDESLVNEINKILDAASTTMQEAYMTAIRVRRAEAKARNFLEARLKKARKSSAPAALPPHDQSA
jgi:ATP-dependent 26S proteasome regulatory subunit